MNGHALHWRSGAMSREQAELLAAALAEGWPEPVAVAAFELPASEAAGAASSWQVDAVFEHAPDPELLAALLQGLGLPAETLVPEALPEVDWVAKVQQGLAPVVAGRFFVHGAHDRQRRKVHLVNIEIEAGQAFGTGHHGTTQGCLLALDWLLQRRCLRPSGVAPVRVLDVGTGSGVLGIAAARALKARVLATDIDPVAVVTARENARLNGAPGMRLAVAAGARHVLVRQMSGGQRPVRRVQAAHPELGRVKAALAASRAPQPLYSRWRVLRPALARRGRRWGYDLVFANILARPLMRMAADLCGQVRPGGWLVLSGLLHAQEAMVLAAFLPRGMRLARRWRLGEWSTLLLRREM